MDDYCMIVKFTNYRDPILKPKYNKLTFSYNRRNTVFYSRPTMNYNHISSYLHRLTNVNHSNTTKTKTALFVQSANSRPRDKMTFLTICSRVPNKISTESLNLITL